MDEQTIAEKCFKTVEQVKHEIEVLKSFGLNDIQIEKIILNPFINVRQLIHIIENNQVT